jgi:hypothetical protein
MKGSRLRCGLAAACTGLGLAVTACGSVTQTGVPTGLKTRAPAPPVAASTVLFDCLHKTRVEPGNFILTCADGNSYLARLSWRSWTTQQAVATGIHELNDCTPYCAAGKFHGYPVVVTFWRSEPVTGHPGERAFTEITVRYTGPRPPAYTSNGALVRNPATWSQSLLPVHRTATGQT